MTIPAARKANDEGADGEGTNREGTNREGVNSEATGHLAAASDDALHEAARVARPSAFRRMVTTLRRRPDSEHEMTINRLAISTIILVYSLTASAFGNADAQSMLASTGMVWAVFYVCAIGLFVHILREPGVSPVRRICAIFLDFGMFSYCMHHGDEATALLYPVYIWVILGNGFRFGIPYLFIASATGLATFGAVVAYTDFWRAHLGLSTGLLVGLVMIPAYTATLIRKLSQAKQAAETASRAKSQFLASISHELRTPLNAIIALSDLLQQTPLDREQEDMTRTVGASGRSLLGLINAILDFSRIEAGRMPLNRAPIDIYDLLEDVRRMLAVQAHAKGVRLAVHVSGRVPRFLNTDRRHLEEMLVNLTGNAVKFTAAGHVVIAVDVTETRPDGSRLRIEITDTGIGIAPEAQGRIFDSFTQADETIIDRFGGTGLGLAIVKQLVEMQGGEIGVASTLGQGSTFWFEVECPGLVAQPAEDLSLGDPVLVVSNDFRLKGLIGQAGLDAIVANGRAQALASLEELRDRGFRHPVVVVDARDLDADPADFGRDLIGIDLANAPLLVLAAEGGSGVPAGGGLLPRRLRPLYATAIPVPIDPVAVRGALAYLMHIEGADAPPVAAPVHRRKLSVLVAEDNRTNQKVITKVLERAGHTALIVENGQQAVSTLAEPGHGIDIVLMDVNMPVMNGIEATRLIRFAEGNGRRIPIVALTADATGEARERCIESGMDDCVTKPIETTRLLDIIEQRVPMDGVPGEVLHSMGSPDGDAEHDLPRLAGRDGNGGATSPVLDRRKIDDLMALGGVDFVEEVVGEFVRDAALVLDELATAAMTQDVAAFREHAHALRSAAANIGAQRIFALCLAWRQMDLHHLTADGEHCLRRLEDEFEAVNAAIAAGALREPGGKPAAEPPLAQPSGREAA
jgi:two-component system sensor histidine kinase RpfC